MAGRPRERQSRRHDGRQVLLGILRARRAWIPRVGLGLFSAERPQKLAQATERLPAVAHGRFLCFSGFPERLAVWRVKEDRVVAESTIALRFGSDPAFDRPARFEQDAIALRERQRA